MVFLRLDDVTGGIECVVFNSTYAPSRELCVADRILIVKGRVDHKEGETKLIALGGRGVRGGRRPSARCVCGSTRRQAPAGIDRASSRR